MTYNVGRRRKPDRITAIVIHTLDVPANWMSGHPVEAKVAEVDRWHREERGWAGIGYHYVIDRDGQIGEGRPIDREGAHARGHNGYTVGIALVGGKGSKRTDEFSDHYTHAQDAALRRLIGQLEHKLKRKLTVLGHYEINPGKECPGFDVRAWLRGHKPRRSPLQSTTIQATGAAGAGVAGIAAQVLGALDGRAQIVALLMAGVALTALAWIARERLRRWAEGDR